MKILRILDQIFLPQDGFTRKMTAWWISVLTLSILLVVGTWLMWLVSRFASDYKVGIATMILTGAVPTYFMYKHIKSFLDKKDRTWWEECKVATTFWCLLFTAYWFIWFLDALTFNALPR